MSQGKKGYLSLRKKIQITRHKSKRVKKPTHYRPFDLDLNLTKSTYFIMDVVNKSIQFQRQHQSLVPGSEVVIPGLKTE